MSSVPASAKVPGHPQTQSADSATKYDDALQGRASGGPIPAEISDPLDEYFARYPNDWAKIREIIREPAAELLGTMMLTLLGNGANCQAILSTNPGVASSPKGDYLSLAFGWGCGLSLGAWISGASGSHVNPVVTLAMAVFGRFPWRKVPGYVLGQLIGAWLGAIIVFANYFHAINIFEGQKGQRTLSTGSLFATYALDYMPAANCFFDEFIGAFILVLVVFAICDKRNAPPPAGLVPLVLFITILGIAVAFGMQTGFAINPARDLGPRIMTAMVGYGAIVFDFRSQYWIWSPILGSVCGGLVAAFLYDAFIYLGPESPLNTPNEACRRHLALPKTTSRPSDSKDGV